MQKPLVIAHRGDSSHALENSLDAFGRALAAHADFIEFDIRMSRDQALYVMHDRDTGRTAEQKMDIEKAVSTEVSGIRLKNGQPVPSLDDVFSLVAGRIGINIEIKSDGAGRIVAHHLLDRRYQGSVVVSSFKEAEVLAFRELMPEVSTALIYDTFSIRHISDYRLKGYSLISLRKNSVTESLVKACHAQGLRVFVWTVDEEDEMKRCVQWGVDGIYTNQPQALQHQIELAM